MRNLPPDVLEMIFLKLDCKSLCRLRCCSKAFRNTVVVRKEDMLVAMLRDVLSGIGFNYQICTDKVLIGDCFGKSYVINIFINFAVVFQKIYTHNGMTVFYRLMTIDRNNVDTETIQEVLSICLEQKPLKVQDESIAGNETLHRFLCLINAT